MVTHEKKMLRLSGATSAFLHQKPLLNAIRIWAENGARCVEITTNAPHIQASASGRYERAELFRTARSLGVKILSLNPGGMDVNLIAGDNEVRALSERLLGNELTLAADLQAEFVVIGSGKVHAMAPAPEAVARSILTDAVGRLVARAESLGVTILMENVPYGFLKTGAALSAFTSEIASKHLGVVYDVANVYGVEDALSGLSDAKSNLKLVHVSDTSSTRWQHTSPGRGVVDFVGVARQLHEIGYQGWSVYELFDGEPPEPRLKDDLAFFQAAGWVV
jgi:sugar phosphate isomerase/epimerase